MWSADTTLVTTVAVLPSYAATNPGLACAVSARAWVVGMGQLTVAVLDSFTVPVVVSPSASATATATATAPMSATSSGGSNASTATVPTRWAGAPAAQNGCPGTARAA